MSKFISNYDDVIDIRDVIERYEELEANEVNDGTDVIEHEELERLLEELKGQGGDKQWKGDWYPITLIRESYFEDAIDDCYDLNALKVPAFIDVKIDYEMLKQYYSEIDYDGITYYYR